MSLFVLLGKLAGAVKEMAVAYRYGVSGVVDAYQLAFTVVTWIPGTLVSVIALNSNILFVINIFPYPPAHNEEFNKRLV